MDENMNVNPEVMEEDDEFAMFDEAISAAGGDVDFNIDEAINNNKEFIQQLAGCYSAEFVISCPDTPEVKAAVSAAKAGAEKKLDAQIAKEERRRAELLATFKELQKQQ